MKFSYQSGVLCSILEIWHAFYFYCLNWLHVICVWWLPTCSSRRIKLIFQKYRKSKSLCSHVWSTKLFVYVGTYLSSCQNNFLFICSTSLHDKIVSLSKWQNYFCLHEAQSTWQKYFLYFFVYIPFYQHHKNRIVNLLICCVDVGLVQYRFIFVWCVNWNRIIPILFNLVYMHCDAGLLFISG